MGIDPAKTKLTPASTYADAMKETDITKLNADTVNELFVSAQASYDQLLFDRWEAGAKMESLLPKPVQDQLDALRNIFAPSNDPQDFKKKCETMVRTELEFLWDGKDSINLEVSGERAALQKAVRKLGKMYNVELTIDIPLTGEYSFGKIAEKMAQQLAPRLFDYDKIEHRNLRDLIGKAYNKFEQNLQTLQDELTKRYHSQGKLVASSDGAAVREKFVAEYAAKFINLVEAFNRQAARTVHKQKKVEAFPLFGKYGKLGRGRSARKVGVDGTGIFTEAGKAAAAPVAYQSEQNRRLAGDGLLLVKQNGRIKLVAPVRGYQMSVELRQALGAMNNFPILSNLADGTMIRYRQNGGPARCDIITDRATGYADQSFAVIGNTIAWEGGGQGFGAIEGLHGREVAEKVRAQRSELFRAPKLSAEQLAEPAPEAPDMAAAVQELVESTIKINEFAQKQIAREQLEVQKREMGKVIAKAVNADARARAIMIARVEAKVARAGQAHSLAFQKHANEYIVRNVVSELNEADLKTIWEKAKQEALIKEAQYEKYVKQHGVGVGGRVYKIGKHALKDGLTGLLVGTALESTPELLKGNYAEAAKKARESALHWAQFGATVSANEYLLSMSKSAAMAGAIILPAIWDLKKAPYELKGSVLVSHATGTAGFLGGMKMAEPLVQKLGAATLLRKGLGGSLGLALGIAGGAVAGKANNYAYENSAAWRKVVDHNATRAVGDALGSSSDLLTAGWLTGLAGGLLEGTGVTLNRLLLFKAANIFKQAAGVAKTAKGPLAVLALIKGGFALYYHLSNGMYEKSIAERLGRRVWDSFTHNNTTPFSWAVEYIGGSYKLDQTVRDMTEKFASYTPDQQKVITSAIIDVVGTDFNNALMIGDSILASCQAQALEHLSQKATAREIDSLYNIAFDQLVRNLMPLTREEAVPEQNKELHALQNQIRHILSVDPSKMGDELRSMISFWTDKNAPKENNPFAGTAVMKMSLVQMQHDKIAAFFDKSGRLIDMDGFVRWILASKVKLFKDQKEGLDFRSTLVALRKQSAMNLIVMDFGI
ncbi:MAG: hypothetical protein ABIJ26_00440, partial [Candidatus Margulisiibacteriota bacterium]